MTAVDAAIARAVRDVTADARRQAAELELLEAFDVRRQSAGHDYGAGQRGAELSRRRRELDRRDPLGELERPTADELRVAWATVGLTRLQRIVEREVYRRATPSSQRTVATWRIVERHVELGTLGATS